MCGYNTENEQDKINEKLKEIYNDNIVICNESILNEIKKSQKDKGMVCSQSYDTENDVRFLYCACAIHRLLGIEKKEDYFINVDKAKEFLDSLQCLEGGFSMIEYGESNGNITI